MSNTSLLGSFGGQDNSALMFRNVLVNGCFRVWQRGASFTPTSLATIYTTDRWACYRPAFATGLLASRQSASGLAGFPNALRVERSSGNAGTSNITANQSIESINMVHLIGQTVTLSFYARVGSGFSAASSILTSSFISGTGTDESLANTGYTGQAVADQSNTVTTSWQRFTHTYTVPSNANELTVQFRYTPTGTSAGNDWFELTGVQLEAGPTATPFERRPYSVELGMCQRYGFEVIGASKGGNYARLGHGGMVRTTTSSSIMVIPPVPLRASPSSATQSGAGGINLVYGGTAVGVNSLGLDGGASSSQFVVLSAGHNSGPAVGAHVFIECNNTQAVSFFISAEL